MPSAIVKVAYVNQAQAGKVNGSIKVEDGTYYGVKPAMLGLFQPGNTYEIQYESSDFKGKTYHKVISVKPAPIEGNVGHAQSFANKGAYGKTDDKTAERIFVCGAINAAISSNQLAVQTTEIVQAVNSLRAAWELTLGKQKTAIEEELGDEVPY